MSNHPDFAHLPAPSGQFPPPQKQPSPQRSLGRIGKIAIIAVAAIVTLGAGVGIGFFVFTQNDDAPSVASPSKSSEENQKSNGETPADEKLIEEDATTAPTEEAGPPEITGECPDGDIEIYKGATQEHSVKICASGIAVGEYSYIGGTDDTGYIVLPATYHPASSENYPAGFWAENGVTTYAALQNRLYVERGDEIGHTVLVDEVWETGNMGNIGTNEDVDGPVCAQPGYDPDLNDGAPACPELAR